MSAIDVNKILFRASGVGNLMSKSGELTLTNQKYLAEVFVQEKYGRRKNIDNKYITKGLAVEEDSMTLYSTFKKRFFIKNEEHFSNAYIKGTPDVIDDVPIIDIKSSYSIFTFFQNRNCLNDIYDWQMQSYMALTGKDEAVLAYCLTDLPGPLLQDELRRLMWKMGATTDQDELYLEAAERLVREHTFGDIPLEERIIEIKIKRDNRKIAQMYSTIEKGRLWIKNNLL